MKTKLLYKDKAGNKLYERFIKSRKVYQLSAKNRQGRLINMAGVKSLARKARLKSRRQNG